MDLIDRQAAIDALEKGKDITAKGEVGGFYNAIIQHDIDKIKQLPSAQPEIIYCKDCKQFRDHRCMKANHHVSEWENCMEVFGAERREG